MKQLSISTRHIRLPLFGLIFLVSFLILKSHYSSYSSHIGILRSLFTIVSIKQTYKSD